MSQSGSNINKAGEQESTTRSGQTIKSENWRNFQKYFAGETLVEEFGFSHFYHFHPLNRLFHVFSLVVSFFILGVFMKSLLGYIGQFGLVLIITYFYSNMHLQSGVIYIVIYNLGAMSQNFTKAISPIYCFLLIIGFLLLQVLAHVLFEKQFPAFRIFEAAVTTPLCVMLMTLHSIFGYEKEFGDEIIKSALQWKTKIEKKSQ